MKRILSCFVAALCLMMSIPNTAYANTDTEWIPTIEVREKEWFNEISAFKKVTDYMDTNFPESEYPYRAYVRYLMTTSNRYCNIVVVATEPILYRPTLTTGSTSSGTPYIQTIIYTKGTVKCYFNNDNATTVTNYGSNCVFRDYYEEISVWANHTIYFENDESRAFFGTPLSSLAVIVKESNRQNSPIIAVISLMPLLISLVVSLLALRKFLRVLQTTLSKG